MAEAIQELETPRIKAVRPVRVFDGALKLGAPDKYEGGAMSIHVERYFKTKLAKPVPAKTVVERHAGTQFEGGNTDTGEPDHFAGVERKRSYTVKNPDEPGGKQDVTEEDLAKGYEYGRTAVAISESESNITKLETKKDFSIVGFLPAERVRTPLVPGLSSFADRQYSLSVRPIFERGRDRYRHGGQS